MAKIELSTESLVVLEKVLKRVLRENQDMCNKMPSLVAKLKEESDEIQIIVQKILVIPRFGPGRPKSPQEVVPLSDRPKYATRR